MIKKIFLIIFLNFTLLSCSILKITDILINNVITNKEKVIDIYDTVDKLINTVDYKPGYSINAYKFRNTVFYRYRKKDSKNALVYVHGGAFRVEYIKSAYFKFNERILENTKNSNYEILLVDYKGKKYPSQSIEVNNVIDYALNHYDKVVIMGDSSGGNLILSTLLKRRDENKPLVDGIVLLSPFTDLSNKVKSRVNKFDDDILFGVSWHPRYLNNNPYVSEVKDLTNPYVSPVYGDYYNFPKTLIHYGANEMLSDDSILVYNNMIKNKVDARIKGYKNMQHTFQLFNIFKETNDSINKISRFLEEIYNDKRVGDK